MEEIIIGELGRLGELVTIMERYTEQAGAMAAQLHVMTDVIQCIGGAVFGALAALAVIGGFKL